MRPNTLHTKDPTADIFAKGLRILILDDSDSDLRRVSRMIAEVRSDVLITGVKTIPEFEESIRSEIFDLCLIDHSLGGGQTSSDAMEIIKTSTIATQMPAVLVTGDCDDTILVEAVRHGFVSYLDKSAITVPALKTVITEALDEVALADTTDDDRLEVVNQVMDEVASLYSSNTKQHLSKIYQNANFLRQCIAQRQLPSPDAIDEIESSCFAVWRFLDEAKHHNMNYSHRPN